MDRPLSREKKFKKLLDKRLTVLRVRSRSERPDTLECSFLERWPFDFAEDLRGFAGELLQKRGRSPIFADRI